MQTHFVEFIIEEIIFFKDLVNEDTESLLKENPFNPSIRKCRAEPTTSESKRGNRRRQIRVQQRPRLEIR